MWVFLSWLSLLLLKFHRMLLDYPGFLNLLSSGLVIHMYLGIMYYHAGLQYASIPSLTLLSPYPRVSGAGIANPIL